MNRGDVKKLATELAEVIEQLIEMQAELHGIVCEKLEAMRRADTGAMLAASHREGEMTSQAVALDGRRRKIVTELCRAVGLPAAEGAGGVTLRALAGRLEPASRHRLLELAGRLREIMLKLAEANRVVELVCREMLVHFKTLFSAMVQKDETTPTYSSQGEVGPVAGARVLDAMG